jgi:hypothetical protein
LLPLVCFAFWPQAVVHLLGCHSTHHPASCPVNNNKLKQSLTFRATT